MDKLMVECVNAHDRCEGSGSCPYCEPVQPLRYENGRFAPKHGITIEQAVSKIETLKLALKKKAEQDFYHIANCIRDEDYEGPHERFTVDVVCHVKPYFDLHMKYILESAERAKKALEE